MPNSKDTFWQVFDYLESFSLFLYITHTHKAIKSKIWQLKNLTEKELKINWEKTVRIKHIKKLKISRPNKNIRLIIMNDLFSLSLFLKNELERIKPCKNHGGRRWCATFFQCEFISS